MNERVDMRLTRRQALKLFAGAAGASLLAACAPKTPAPSQPEVKEPTEAPAPEEPAEEPEPTEAPPAAEAITLRFYANADATRNDWVDKVAKVKFEEMHPEITIEQMIIPWDEFDPKLTSMFAAGDLPEMWGNWGSTSYAEYILRGMGIPEEEYIEADREFLDIEDIPEPIIEGLKVRGSLIGLPMYILGTYTYYHKDVFDAAGVGYPPSDWDDTSWDWDAMVAVATQLTKDYDDPTVGQYGVMTSLAAEDMPWLWGHDIWSQQALAINAADEILLDAPAAIEAFQAFADLVCKDKVAPDASISSALWAAGDPFHTGKVAMNISGGWGFWGLKEAEEAFRWGAAALPRGPNGDLKDQIYADPIIISSQTPYKDQAWQFLRYIYSLDGMRDFVLATWSPPSRGKLLPDWAGLWAEDVRDELMQSLAGSWKYGETSPWNRIAGYSQFWDILWAELDPAILCEATMEEVLPIAKQKVDEVLAGLDYV